MTITTISNFLVALSTVHLCVDCVRDKRRKSGADKLLCAERSTDNDARSLVGNYGLIIKRDDRQQAEQNRRAVGEETGTGAGKIGWRRGRKDG